MQKNKQVVTVQVQKLSDVVTISRQFLRSVRLDADLGREDALLGYVCQGTARGLLESMARQIRDTNQRAFIWTGPYGSGKSSLALMLCSLVSPTQSIRARAKVILDLPEDSAIHAAFNAQNNGWLVVPIVGKRAKVTDELSKALALAAGQPVSRLKGIAKQDVIGELIDLSEQHPSGVLVVIDELGKFLESAAYEGDDVYFFQELAEAASRSNGKIVVVGILHQSFDAYAARLGRQARDEWAKVQGRYIDIPLVAGTDEVIELVGRAIEVDPRVDRTDAAPFAKIVARSIRERRPGTSAGINAALARCWPLHPVVAALIGPISRRRFSQNERSTFGFLASRESLGFVEFLEGSSVAWSSMYGPARYWDYLRANLEPAILSSPDGHRWAVASEAVERTEAKGTALHIELTKCVALIEMFRNGSGIVPELEVLSVCVDGAAPSLVAEALHDLVAWKILIERKHLGAYGVFAGSDFDIEAAVNHARTEIGTPDLQRLSSLTDLQPILAKRLYHETGTMRWFSRRIVRLEDAELEASNFTPDKGSVGAFLLCLPELSASATAAKNSVKKLAAINQNSHALVIGIPENADRIAELGLELVACEQVLKARPELDGDAVARKELLGRTAAVRLALEDELSDAFSLSKWYCWGQPQDNAAGDSISWIASNIAAKIFPKTPRLHNELINRDEPSSTSKRARKDLMYRMVSHGSQANLGYSTYSADAGIYYGLVKTLGLHREASDGGDDWAFTEPFAAGRNQPMYELWLATRSFLLKEGPATKLSDLYEFWAKPPYGLRAGVMPPLAIAFFLANRSCLALYVDRMFSPDLTEATIDEWLFDPKSVALKFVSASSDQSAFVLAVANSVPSESLASRQPLDVARALVSLVLSLPNWTRRTTTVSAKAQAVRAMLLKANDPHKVLFADLPTLLEATDANDAERKLQSITSELLAAYPAVLDKVKTSTLLALDQSDGDVVRLRARAKAIKGITGDFKLESFIAQLEVFDGSTTSIESLVSNGTSKPPAQWVDRDIDLAVMQLASSAHEFRRVETLAPLRERPSTRRSIGVVFGIGRGKEVTASVDIDEKHASTISRLAAKLVVNLQQQPKEIQLAALAEAGALLFEDQTSEKKK